MSKMDIARGMSLDETRKRTLEQPERDLSEAEILEMRLTLLQKMDMEKLKSTVELMKTLQDLNRLIRTSTSSVQEAAREVRAYPAEVITQFTAKAEKSVTACKSAADEAEKTYKSAQQLVTQVDKFVWRWIILTGVMTCTAMIAVLLRL